jgi:hypothetical protein
MQTFIQRSLVKTLTLTPFTSATWDPIELSLKAMQSNQTRLPGCVVLELDGRVFAGLLLCLRLLCCPSSLIALLLGLAIGGWAALRLLLGRCRGCVSPSCTALLLLILLCWLLLLLLLWGPALPQGLQALHPASGRGGGKHSFLAI